MPNDGANFGCFRVYNDPTPPSPPKKRKRWGLLPPNKHLNEVIATRLKRCDSPPTSFMRRLDSVTSISDFIGKATQYFMDPKELSQLQDVLEVRKVMFESINTSIVISYEEFVLLAPFFMSWHMRYGNPQTLKSGYKVMRFKCKWGEEKSDGSKVNCGRRMRVLIDSKNHKVTIDLQGKHSHDIINLVEKYPTLYLRGLLQLVVGHRKKVESAEMIELMHLELQKNEPVTKWIGLDDITTMWVRNRLRKRPC